MKLILEKPDTFGALASTLCVVHCLATPFIFVAQSCALHGCQNTPDWWQNLNFVFIVISFFAVLQSSKNTSKPFMKSLLWATWSVLLFLVLNEKMVLIRLPEVVTHVTAITLAVLHLYNLKYCQCKADTCCASNS